jgi:predicted metal-dependent hydrolase
VDRRAPGAVAATGNLRAAFGRPSARPGARGVVWVERDETGPTICVAGDLAHVARRVADFLKREARRDLEAAVARYSTALGVEARRITLRDTTSRWGSCSSTGALNFSWRLILAPSFVLDYLAAHEVAHFVHMNHSPAFWKITRRLFPETDRAEEWLKNHGADLHRFGAKKA